MQLLKYFAFLCFIILLCLFVTNIFSFCNQSKNKTAIYNKDSSIVHGKALAAVYCSSCHLFPNPSLLDKKTWQTGVLPAMGPSLGIFQYNWDTYPSRKNDPDNDKNYYPSSPVITLGQWQNIIDYYTATAPDSLPNQQRNYSIQNNLSLFKTEIPKFKYANPATCLVNFDSTLHQLFVGDAISKKIFRFNKNLQIIDSANTGGPVVDMHIQHNKILACNMGIINPNDGKHGTVEYINIANGKMQTDAKPLFDSLRRPVQVTETDLNNDGKPDYLICEFGNLQGDLCWMENVGNGKFTRHILRAMPGAIKAYINDYNHDGLPDIWALFAQGDECIMLFTNKGNGNFDQKQVLRFPPMYGSSSFSLVDFNNDGYADILYTSGDNADYSTILKPYHGVYIFLNDGKNNFKQKYFYPINGCYKAIAKDFDNDGDLDIATIAFFADYQHQPEESFVYFENKGNFDFQPYSLPAARLGRWLTMDASDIDGDGKTDLILGNFSAGPSKIKSSVNWKQGPPFIVLKNVGKK